ncbi:sortase [Paenibacillus selenitireducens]|uniref:Sortase n=1 Tax=Paenibacillus selenitireducens TaxID=1324314 RepID=A0A1T2XMG6_9BACL|nr:class D sortase [Paenibacillus selenitireducens]OPA81008.1 sortase [Paenibacillus selenitireducens]
MKYKMMSVLLIVIGIIVFSYPKLSEWVDDWQQQRLLTAWHNSLRNIDAGDDVPGANETNGRDELPNEQTILDRATMQASTESKLANQQQNIEGILIIDKIDLKLPILYGATNKNMKTSVAQIEKTGKPGEVGNLAIAGHRNRTYGRNFNRLDEMEKGDTIEVETENQQFQYVVTEKFTVKPDEVWVLEPQGHGQEITLVTCEPMVNPTHRLIIKGKILE